MATLETTKPPRPRVPPKNDSAKDNVMTPDDLANRIVRHFPIGGRVLEPCAGDGAFVQALFSFVDADIDWCENRHGARYYRFGNFFDWHYPVDWIVTNPPYSQLTAWMKHCFEVADNVVLLVEAPAPFFTARHNAARDAGFAIREMVRVPTPSTWPQSGFGIAAVHWQRNYDGPMKTTDWTTTRDDRTEGSALVPEIAPVASEGHEAKNVR